MEVELEAGGGEGGGSRVVSLSADSPEADLGRGDLGPAPAPPADRTVSRRHVSLRLLGGGEPRVSFEVVGRNPVVFRSSVGGDKVYRRGEAGELRAGDGLSLSLKAPSFWTVRRRGGEGEGEGEGEEEEDAGLDAAVLDAVARRERRTQERKERERRAVEEAMEVTGEEAAAAGSGELDADVEDLKLVLASIDPVQEFGFLLMGHDFDNYPKGRIHPPKDWNWFLEEIRRSSDDEDDDVSNKGGRSKGSRGSNKKNKEGEGEDEEWTGESEDEKDSLPGGLSVKKRSKYVTRSKDPKKPRKENPKAIRENKDVTHEEDESVEEDEEDETLGGFIVNEEDEPMEELSEEEDEEGEFDAEDDDD